MSDSNRMTPKSQRLPLRFLFTVPFALQLIVVVTLTNLLWLHNGQKAVENVAVQLRSEVAERIRSHVQHFLETPNLIVQLNQHAIAQGTLDLENKTAVQQHFWRQIQLFPYMTYISYGNVRGEYVGVTRDPNKLELRLSEANPSTKGALNTYTVDERGDRIALLQSDPNFDPRQRQWYQEALKTDKPVWVPIYKYSAHESMGIGVVAPIYDQKGQWRGALTANLALAQIGNFLQKLEIGSTGQAAILETNGDLVSLSNDELPYRRNGNAIERLKAVDAQSPLIRHAVRFLKQRYGDMNSFIHREQFDFQIDGKRQYLEVVPYRDDLGLNWLIIVVVPEADFMSRIASNTQFTVLLCGIAILIAIGIGYYTSLRIARPILNMRDAAKAIAGGQFDQHVPTGTIMELSDLGRAFNRMSAQVRKAISELRESNAYLFAIVNNLSSGLLVVDLSNLISTVNPSFLEMLGLSEPETVGRDYRELLSAELIQLLEQPQKYPGETFEAEIALMGGRIGQAVASAIPGDRPEHENARIPPPSAADALQSAHSTTYLGVMVLIRDITREKELDRLKTDLLSNISHELRTPLVSIMGFTKVINKKFKEAVVPMSVTAEKKTQKAIDQFAANLEIVQSESQRLAEIIAGVLDITNLESDRVVWNWQPVSLEAVMRHAVQNMEDGVRAKNLALIVEIAPGLPTITGDGERLQQVVQHLLCNAVAFTQTGSITCSVKHDPHRNGKTGRGEIVIRVSDTGIGIAPDNLESVFEKFKQVGDVLTNKPHGIGLGLSICKAIVVKHRGRIWAESQLGKGSTFAFTLPLE